LIEAAFTWSKYRSGSSEGTGTVVGFHSLVPKPIQGMARMVEGMV
jgi:hypothetical protein